MRPNLVLNWKLFLLHALWFVKKIFEGFLKFKAPGPVKCTYCKNTFAIVYEVEANRLVSLLTTLFFIKTKPLKPNVNNLKFSEDYKTCFASAFFVTYQSRAGVLK